MLTWPIHNRSSKRRGKMREIKREDNLPPFFTAENLYTSVNFKTLCFYPTTISHTPLNQKPRRRKNINSKHRRERETNLKYKDDWVC